MPSATGTHSWNRDGPPRTESPRAAAKALMAVIQDAYIHGVSTCAVDDPVRGMGLTGTSKSQVSRLREGGRAAIVARTMYGWLPRGKSVSVEAGVNSGAAMYTASGLQHDGCAP